MADVLIYWRDYAANWAYHAKCVAEFLPGDRMCRSVWGQSAFSR